MKASDKVSISVVIPVYNQEKYVGKCIRSVLGQSFQDFEVILVNDGSTDKSLKICQKYAKRDSRITIIDKRNGGQAQARKDGFLKAKGEYICFLDSDDYFASNALDALFEIALEKNVDLVIGNLDSVYDNWGIIKKPSLPFPHAGRLIDREEYLSLILGLGKDYDNNLWGSVVWGNLFRRTCILKAIEANEWLLFYNTVMEDMCFMMAIAPFLETVWISNIVVTHYRYGGISCRDYPAIRKGAIYFDERFDRCVSTGRESLLPKVFEHYCMFLFRDIGDQIHFHSNTDNGIMEFIQKEVSQRKIVLWARENKIIIPENAGRKVFKQAVLDGHASFIMKEVYEWETYLQRVHYPRIKLIQLYQKIVDVVRR